MRASGKSVGASCRGQPGRASIVCVRSRVVFQLACVPTSRDFAASSKPPRPGAWSFERLISDAYHLSRLVARSRVPLCVSGYDLASCAASLHASPKGDFPQPPARRLPRHGARCRALEPARRWPIRRKHRATVPLALHRASMKVRRPRPQRMKSHARRLRDRHPVLCRLPGTLFPRGIERDGQFLERCRFTRNVLPSRFYLQPVKILLATLRSNLTGSGWISLSKTKYRGGYADDTSLLAVQYSVGEEAFQLNPKSRASVEQPCSFRQSMDLV